MTIAHHKGELLRADNDVLEYRYFPDHVMAPGLSGVFRVRPGDWSVENVLPARAEDQGLRSDDSCIGALLHKLKRAYVPGTPPPDTLWFIA